jgi:DNA repair protein RadC
MFHQRAESPLRINGLEQARRFFAGCLAEADPAKEHLWVAHVDDDARCLHLMRCDGRADGAELPIREIIVDAARHGSKGLILAHNHPSGDARPSATDKRITRRLALVSEAMDVAILDHLVLTTCDCRSMRQMGLL